MLPCAGENHGGRRGQWVARSLVDGIGQIRADEIALDDVANVGGLGNRDADAETLDGQAADDALGGVKHEARCASRCGLPSRITRTCALLPSIAATVFGTEVISLGGERDPSIGLPRKTLGATPPVRPEESATSDGICLARVCTLERD